MNQFALFASGRGSNAEKIIDKCRKNVAVIYSSNAMAGVVDVAKNNHIPVVILDKHQFLNTEDLLSDLKSRNVVFIALAGFLWKIPDYLIKNYPEKIINLHPALLPKFGGKGMFGMNVHKAVVAAREHETGITIHYVNEHYDEGEIIFQEKCDVLPTDTPIDIAHKVQQLEHKYFPEIICKYTSDKYSEK